MTISNQLLCEMKEIAADEKTSGTTRVLVKLRPRVLVVEDQPFDGALLMAFLANRTCDPMWVKTGESAIDVLSSGQRFDVMFLDLTLSGQAQGVDVLRHVLAHKIKVAIVVVSGFIPEELKGSLGCRMGVLRVIEKPVSQKDVDEIFDSHRFALES